MNDLIGLDFLQRQSALSHFFNKLGSRDFRELHCFGSLFFDGLPLLAGELQDGVSQPALFHLQEHQGKQSADDHENADKWFQESLRCVRRDFTS